MYLDQEYLNFNLKKNVSKCIFFLLIQFLNVSRMRERFENVRKRELQRKGQ